MDKATLKQIIHDEGDHKVFDYKDYTCIVRRTDLLILCGYVAIPRDCKFYGKDYLEIEKMTNFNIPSHGGLTFSGFNVDDDYLIGFDCAHAGDIIPSWVFNAEFNFTPIGDEVYRNMSYVENVLKEIVDYIISYGESHD